MRLLSGVISLALATAASAQDPSGRSGPPAGDQGAPMLDGLFSSGGIRSAAALTQVFGEGQKTTAVVLDYGRPILSKSLTAASFSVQARTITRVYASQRPSLSDQRGNGRYVVIELNPSDAGAATYNSQGPVHRPASVGVKQILPVTAVDGSTVVPTGRTVTNTRQVNLVVDEFVQRKFVDPATGLALPYNLYIPKGYRPGKRYPLVLFMHDAGVTGPDPTATLSQGLGATVWASAQEQAKHEAFVLAPQYPAPIVNDASQASDYLDVTVNLLRALQREYSVDPDRLYTTGQSGGCMMSIAMNIKYPNLFAASYLVAGQWDPARVAPMARNKLFIVVSEDDSKAWPGMNAVTERLEREGGSVRRATWDATWNSAQFDAAVAALLKQGGNVHYVAFRKGTVIPPGQSTAGASGHRNTWRIAYTIEGVRDWLFRQHKGS